MKRKEQKIETQRGDISFILCFSESQTTTPIFPWQMDSVETNHHVELNESVSAEQTVSAEVSDICDVFGDPEILPRVGDQYQVEIPSLISESDYLKLSMNPCEVENEHGSNDFLLGLPIPVMWISEETKSQKHEQQEEAYPKGEIRKKDESLRSPNENSDENGFKPKVELLNISSDNGTKLGESADLTLQEEILIKVQEHGGKGEEILIKVQEHGGKGYSPVPGLWGNAWSNIEEASFLLGLYIFGKNLSQVKDFVGSKQTGDILSYYYGRFYRSDRYCRWSECRKIRSRRCIYGQRIFTGLRQQELLSRLLPHVSEECQNTLLEISKAFGEGKILLEEYVFTLKASVGLNALVEGVGIGKGKQDLTGMAMENSRSNQVPVRPEIPVGKACSTLTTLEIVNFLTGDFRLSKARSSDLFWEAVWPRLLARGWHSEQPNNNGSVAGSRHSLVFLIPGIKKFSRRKLVKGVHYFDSVSDVLSKVASDPGLLDIEGCKSKEENGWTDETKLDKEDFPNQQRHCYLKPRTPNRSTDIVKFTVVDTSLANGKTCKVRELRSLPVQIMNTSTIRSDSDDDDGDTSDNSEDNSSSSDIPSSDKDGPNDFKAPEVSLDKRVSSGRKYLDNDASNKGFPVNGPVLTNIPTKIPKDKDSDKCNDTQPNNALKCQLNRKIRPEDENHLAPVTKRRRRKPPSTLKETSHSTNNTRLVPSLLQEASCCVSVDNSDHSESIFSRMDPSQEKLSSTSSSRGGSPITSSEGQHGNHIDAEHAHEKPQPRTLIDLNIPVTSDVEADEPFMMETTERQDERTSNEPDSSSHAVNTSKNMAADTEQEESKVSSRRQSTRNRPLTTKVLEAFACGFLDIKQKRKSKDAFPGENSNSRPSRRSRARVGTPESINSSSADLSMEDTGTAIQNNNGDVLSKLGISSQSG
ncbi:uncharacterized protein LOC107433269 isoform X1 [Ziziphus jujuba]|uniref:Uncharacterized protein LOC107433269 isoform X1 n=2 Tax=Ziziphus jujuba TaxID=326968 RepID=A0ABM3I511_ZIZJJ|nr:uncharacterized protein LOC107433269 isoform X1 [Ziziphus jujuba]XP_048320743.2 uncharacterized protein LOC107433269 isoform X1 [Ziziphus jujuba]XP_048320744.2 uncharacterized protein LOC107433269 isoform X1 [Ziziphus jujuba]